MTTEMTLAEIEAEIADIAAKLKPLGERIEELERVKRKLVSRNWIAANNVTRDQVELSDGDDKPFFCDVFEFGKWMKENNVKKRFCEWNGLIYFTAEIIAGKMDRNASACIDHLPAQSS